MPTEPRSPNDSPQSTPFSRYRLRHHAKRFGLSVDSARVAWLTMMLVLPVLGSSHGAEPLPSSPAKNERPNILFIFSDDHALQAIGAYGGRYRDLDPTPHIDRLARQGMIFRSSFCTNSICGPSRAVILTGKHSHLNGFTSNGNRFNGDQQTFPKLLQQGGYTTALFGKWHLEDTPQGFDAWRILPGQGEYYNPVMISPKGKERIPGYCSDLVTDLAIDWLDNERDRKKPFMLMVQHKAPHRNWMPPERYLNLYDNVTFPEPETLFDRYTDNASPARNQEMEIDRHMDLVSDLFADLAPAPRGPAKPATSTPLHPHFRNLTPAQIEAWHRALDAKNEAFAQAQLRGEQLVRWKYQRYMQHYMACVKSVDDSVGTLIEYLEKTGLRENTVVIYSSDQGFYLGDHGWYDKRWMYEESLAMPLIVHWPGVTPPESESTQMVQNLDYAETFLDLAGIAIPADMQGVSLVPLLRGEKPRQWRDAIYYHYYEFPGVHSVARHYGIRTERYKLISFYQTGEWEFYDLAEDPDERTSAYHEPRYEATIADLKVRLETLRREYQDDTVAPPESAAEESSPALRGKTRALPGKN